MSRRRLPAVRDFDTTETVTVTLDSSFVTSLRPANKLLGQAAWAKSLGKATSRSLMALAISLRPPRETRQRRERGTLAIKPWACNRRSRRVTWPGCFSGSLARGNGVRPSFDRRSRLVKPCRAYSPASRTSKSVRSSRESGLKGRAVLPFGVVAAPQSRSSTSVRSKNARPRPSSHSEKQGPLLPICYRQPLPQKLGPLTEPAKPARSGASIGRGDWI